MNSPTTAAIYENCATCYQTFSNALVNTEDNKYSLSRAFSPIDAAPPVQVEVYYQSKSKIHNETLFWMSGGFYIFQPLNVFLYRSLFFSPPKYRQDSVTITLPDECFGGQRASEFF